MKFTRANLEKAINAGLKSTINDHGAISKDKISSASKRIIGQIQNMFDIKPSKSMVFMTKDEYQSHLNQAFLAGQLKKLKELPSEYTGNSAEFLDWLVEGDDAI